MMVKVILWGLGLWGLGILTPAWGENPAHVRQLLETR